MVKIQTKGLIAVMFIIAVISFSGCTAPEDEGVKIGTLLSVTGDLAPYGGPMQKAAILAIEEVNANGGLLGKPVTLINEDSQTSEIAAVDAANKLVNINKVPAIIGAAGSSISLSFIEITTGNHVVQISPSNTAPDFTTYEDDDFYFRTCPSDALQGKAMALLAIEENYTTASTLVLNNAYGVGFEKVFVEEFEKMGGKVLDRVKYDPQATLFNSEIENAIQNKPDVIILISYPETGSLILKAAYEKGAMDNTEWLLSEGLKDEGLAESVGKDTQGKYIIAGFKGTAPDPTVTGPAYETFNDAYMAKYGTVTTTFTANTYDAAAVIALAVEKAGSTDGTAIRDNIRAIANPPGVEVTDIGEGLRLIREGTEINYQGASGDVNFDENGDITTAYYAKWQVAEDGSVEWGESIDLE
ncbi:MAG: ABC transporter substrate-binding protein [Methanosarcinales archaeon]|nr:ABC transporter substrate-binding protein [ANME-2 cluster archaeon]MDF1532779.1 ABC transporter substrate-binding protein [ANME-2 cluster archaeon]MDW7775829.1 ABC transporter substrate-binding protein [Methanosarcinales archaeon]